MNSVVKIIQRRTNVAIGQSRYRIIIRPALTIDNGGGSANVNVFTQPTPSTLWTVTHGLGRYPIVRLKTLGTAEIEGEINHVTVDQFTVTLNSPMAGQALYV